MLTWLARLIADRIEREVKTSLRPLPSYLRKIGGGFALIVVSILGWSASFVFLLLAFFFNLAKFDQLVAPALWSSLLSFGLALLLTLLGGSFLRPPR